MIIPSIPYYITIIIVIIDEFATPRYFLFCFRKKSETAVTAYI